MRSHRAALGGRGVLSARDGNWFAAVPAWGERCVDVFIRATLPALAAALRGLDRPATLLVWTDQPDAVAAAYAGTNAPANVQLECAPVPAPSGRYAGLHAGFGVLSTCHALALGRAAAGDRVLLLTADMVVSREVLATCEAQVASGKRLVACAAMRANEGGSPPLGADGAELSAWAWDNRHPMTRDCTWPDGRSYDLWRIYFEREGEVAARVFLPHPLACVPAGRSLQFYPTIDVNLVRHFTQSETHMITHPSEGAVVELSPPDKEYLRSGAPMSERLKSRTESSPQLIPCANPHQRMFFGRRAVIRGAGGDCGDQEIVSRVLG